MRYLILILLVSCAHDMAEKAPKLSFSETFYKVDSKPGVMFHMKCKKPAGDNRKCVRTEFNIIDVWSELYPNFILIRSDKVFK